MSEVHKYKFGETDHFVTGPHFSLTVMREGLVVGDLVSVRFNSQEKVNLGGRARFELEFARVTDGRITGVLGFEIVELFKRYMFLLPFDSLSFAIRAAVERHSDHQRSIVFQVASLSKIIKAKNYK